MKKQSSKKERQQNSPQAIITANEKCLWNGSFVVNESELLEKRMTAMEYSFPIDRISETDSQRNPGLNDEMIHLGLLHAEPRFTDRNWCVHCDENEAAADSNLCKECSETVFSNNKLEFAYKYCNHCHDFHYFMYFVPEDCSKILDTCVNCPIPTDPSFNIQISCSPPSKRKMCCSEMVMTVLRNRGLLWKEKDHCIHCRCNWITSNDFEVCPRCRSGFFFSIPVTVLEDDFVSKRRKTGDEGKVLVYRWCNGCKQFHWLKEFRDTKTRSFLLQCHLYSVITHGIRFISPQSLPTDDETVLASLAQTYQKSPSELTFAILHFIRKSFGHSLQNRCVRCLKKNLSRFDMTKNRTVFGKRVNDVNIANEPLVCTSCQPDILQISNLAFPVKYCVHCNLFHPIFFFDLTSHVYETSCNQHIVEVAWIQNMLPELPTISVIPVSLSPLDPVTLTTKSLNRCRSPMCFQLFVPSHSRICAHCQRVLLEDEITNGICLFCQNHWFVDNEGRRYHYCRGCRAFHFAGFFYDPEKKRFDEICLPSQLNRPRQRSKDRTKKQSLMIPGDKADLLPSVDAMKLVCSHLTLENPHEKMFTGLFIACIMEELWKHG